MGVALANCSSNTYKIKQEKDKQVLKVPSWYMKDYNEKKECGTKTFGKGKDKVCIFGVGTSVSPDLELATILGTFQSTLTNFKYVSAMWKKNCSEERLLGVSLTGIMDGQMKSITKL